MRMLAGYPQGHPQVKAGGFTFAVNLDEAREEIVMDSRTIVAESYLSMLKADDPHAGMYVRLAYNYRVPFGKIVDLTGFDPAFVVRLLERGD